MASRNELILKMQSAILLYESAHKSGDQVSMDVAELVIEQCERLLGWKRAS